MKKEMIVRAWKDPAFRASLTAEQRTEIPESPSGRPMSELDETDLDGAVGGHCPPNTSIGCPISFRLICNTVGGPRCIAMTPPIVKE
ncbi:mersacidin/lichenicidin family type 2 lantibiotic [Archangium lansingense]|uniref:Mersacidin/lichenicidin family type 2 lantibiotic n=1 Tax=Archangium lansingense TaxID=2995310 RepID=A0ABT4A6E3_9BACT|nr:mersacidin/lichenicidin family type 2 lantibiotic [Archangium lansinium]MCY1077222.1 mersacidin/lichenicidin family type 2 lantibiotic [Archangium lansinium]